MAQKPNFFADPDLIPEADQMGLDSSEDDESMAELLAEVEQPAEEEVQQEESDLSEVDQRLEVAMYYRELLRAPLFNEESPAAQLVSDEVREFVKGRLGVLMGVRPEDMVKPSKAQQFEPEEADRLKSFLNRFGEPEMEALSRLAGHVVKRPQSISKDPPPPKAPTVRPAAAPEAKAETPQPAPKAPVKKPPAPAPRRPAAATFGRKPPAKAPGKAPGKAPAKPTSGLKVEVGPNGEKVVVRGHRKFVAAESRNEPGKLYVKEITKPVSAPSLSVPMPGLEQMEGITSDHASRSVNNSNAKNPLIANAAAISIITPHSPTNNEERP